MILIELRIENQMINNSVHDKEKLKQQVKENSSKIKQKAKSIEQVLKSKNSDKSPPA